MKMTAPEAVTKVWQVLKTSNIPADVTPNIYKYERPLNHVGECVVVNSLPMTTEQYQNGVVNVNYFVPNLKDKTVNPVDETQPNSGRLQLGAKKIDALFTELQIDDIYLNTIHTIQMRNEPFNEWYINLRIEFKNINL